MSGLALPVAAQAHRLDGIRDVLRVVLERQRERVAAPVTAGAQPRRVARVSVAAVERGGEAARRVLQWRP